MTIDIENMSEDLLVARILSVDERFRKIYLRFRKGLYCTVDVLDTSTFQKGSIVTINTEDSTIELVPDEVWDEEPWIGVVHLIKEEGTVVSTGGQLRLVPNREDPPYKVGNTVAVKDDFGVVTVLLEKPMGSLDAPHHNGTSSRFEFKGGSSGETYEDFGGFDDVVEQVKELEDTLTDNEALASMGGRPVKGVLFVGQPGTGKTMMARIIANQTKAKFYEIKGSKIVNKYFGETERELSDLFEIASHKDSAIIFFDEIDSIAGRREGLTHESSRHVVTTLLELMDGFETSTNVLVIAATNRPDALDPAFRRPGRFDMEIKFKLPGERDREEILRASARKQGGSDGLPHALIAKKTDSWTPAELAGIWATAVRVAFKDDRRSVDEEDYLIGYEQAAAQIRREPSPQSGMITS